KVWIVLIFRSFNIPVGNTIPDSVVDSLPCFGVTVIVKGAFNRLFCLRKFADDPVVGKCNGYRFLWLEVVAKLFTNETSNVPKLIAEVTTRDNAVDTKCLILARATTCDEAKAKSI